MLLLPPCSHYAFYDIYVVWQLHCVESSVCFVIILLALALPFFCQVGNDEGVARDKMLELLRTPLSPGGEAAPPGVRPITDFFRPKPKQ